MEYFEQAFLTVEINTTRGLAAQILRHRSFTFQEFSQRYADTNLLSKEIPVFDLRSQDNKNRQNSIDDIDSKTKEIWEHRISQHFDEAIKLYNQMLDEGIAKECARFVLPLATPTRLYMSGTVRSWIHYIDLRSGNGTQKNTEILQKNAKRFLVTISHYCKGTELCLILFVTHLVSVHVAIINYSLFYRLYLYLLVWCGSYLCFWKIFKKPIDKDDK